MKGDYNFFSILEFSMYMELFYHTSCQSDLNYQDPIVNRDRCREPDEQEWSVL